MRLAFILCFLIPSISHSHPHSFNNDWPNKALIQNIDGNSLVVGIDMGYTEFPDLRRTGQVAQQWCNRDKKTAVFKYYEGENSFFEVHYICE